MASASSAKKRTAAAKPAPRPDIIAEEEHPHVATYPVEFVLANNGSGGNSSYVLNLTEKQIYLLLGDNESPHWVRIPKHYFAHNGNNESRFLPISNVGEVHISNFNPPPDLEWPAE